MMSYYFHIMNNLLSIAYNEFGSIKDNNLFFNNNKTSHSY